MNEYDNDNRIIDPHRNDLPATDHTNDWIKAATAVILLISAITAIIKHSTDEEDWRD